MKTKAIVVLTLYLLALFVETDKTRAEQSGIGKQWAKCAWGMGGGGTPTTPHPPTPPKKKERIIPNDRAIKMPKIPIKLNK